MLYARWQFDDLPRRELAELGDALLASAAEDELDEITRRAVRHVWTDELERDVRDCIVELQPEPDYVDMAARALYELDTQHGECRLARRFVQQVAFQYAHDALPPLFCLCCLDQGVENRSGQARRAAALEAVVIAWGEAGIAEPELRAAVRLSTLAPDALPALLATNERRAAVRGRLERVARLGVGGVPHLSRELRRILAEPMPDDARDDVVWSALCSTLAERRLRPVLN